MRRVCVGNCHIESMRIRPRRYMLWLARALAPGGHWMRFTECLSWTKFNLHGYGSSEHDARYNQHGAHVFLDEIKMAAGLFNESKKLRHGNRCQQEWHAQPGRTDGLQACAGGYTFGGTGSIHGVQVLTVACDGKYLAPPGEAGNGSMSGRRRIHLSGNDQKSNAAGAFFVTVRHGVRSAAQPVNAGMPI